MEFPDRVVGFCPDKTQTDFARQLAGSTHESRSDGLADLYQSKEGAVSAMQGGCKIQHRDGFAYPTFLIEDSDTRHDLRSAAWSSFSTSRSGI